ncbi:hypothetical protein Q5752_001512 [Cryptotrichosporon argae]
MRRNSSPGRPQDLASRGRSVSTSGLPGPSNGVPRSATPPPYARHSLDRSPLADPRALDDRPRVPPPIYLRSSSPQPQSSKGTLKIHIPGLGVALVRPPRHLELHPLENGGAEPPTADTVLSGALEVIMKERRRVQAISVGVQSVCRLHMGVKRGWEEDGVFERGVEILGGDAEGMWLEKGSQSFSFNIILPATLATHDWHSFARISYIITARVEGIADAGGLSSLWKSREVPVCGVDVPFRVDFDNVIARSDKLAHELALGRTSSRDSVSRHLPSGTHAHGTYGHGSPRVVGSPLAAPLDLGSPLSDPDDAIAIGESSPTLNGLYHRRQSNDFVSSPPPPNFAGAPMGSPLARQVDPDAQSIVSIRSAMSALSTGSGSDGRSEKTGWLKGDISAVRGLVVHALPSASGGVYELDVRKEGYVPGLGSWRFTASADVFAISSAMLVAITVPSPAPSCTIFFVRLLLVQSYTIRSPRTPNDPPHKPEAPRNHVLYQIGRPHRPGEKVLAHNVPALWRGPGACGKDPEGGWKTRAVVRLPNHDKIRPSTNEGTITPIRVTHDLTLQIFYSVEGETVTGRPIKGPGEVRMCQIRVGVLVPSCCCTTPTLDLPTYDTPPASPPKLAPDDHMFDRPLYLEKCLCGQSFAQLGEAAMRRMADAERDAAAGATAATEPGAATGPQERPGYRRSASERGKAREAGER